MQQRTEHDASISAVVLRCACGQPDTHRGRPCHRYRKEDLGVISRPDWAKQLLESVLDRLHRLLAATVVTNGGVAIISNRILAGGTEPKQIGWGTAAGTSAVTDTTLFGEVDPGGNGAGSRTAGTSSRVTTTVTNDTYQVTGTVTATTGLTITNAGLWDNGTIGSGNLFLKGDFTGIALNNGDSIAFTFKDAYTAG